jgi:hypothetical protein
MIIMFGLFILSLAFAAKEAKSHKKDEEIAVDIMSSAPDKHVECKRLIYLFAARSSWYMLGIWAGCFSIIYSLLAVGILAVCGGTAIFTLNGFLVMACLFAILFLLSWIVLYKYRGHIVYHTFNPQRKIKKARDEREERETRERREKDKK